MLKFRAKTNEGVDAVGMGLTWANLKRLRDGHPILVRVQDWYPELRLWILIMAGESGETIETDILAMPEGARTLLKEAPETDAEGALRAAKRLALEGFEQTQDPAAGARLLEIARRAGAALGDDSGLVGRIVIAACPKCGLPVSTGRLVCPGCGARLGEEPRS